MIFALAPFGARLVHILAVLRELTRLHDSLETLHHQIEAVAPVLMVAHLVLADVEVVLDGLLRLVRTELALRELLHRLERLVVLLGVADEKALEPADEGFARGALEPLHKALRIRALLLALFVEALQPPENILPHGFVIERHRIDMLPSLFLAAEHLYRSLDVLRLEHFLVALAAEEIFRELLRIFLYSVFFLIAQFSCPLIFGVARQFVIRHPCGELLGKLIRILLVAVPEGNVARPSHVDCLIPSHNPSIIWHDLFLTFPIKRLGSFRWTQHNTCCPPNYPQMSTKCPSCQKSFTDCTKNVLYSGGFI